MRRLHPATIAIKLLPALKEAVRTTFPVFIGAVATGHGGNNDWIAALFTFFVGSFAIEAYWTTRFDIEPDHVVHRSGWIFRRDRRIPLEQIQNVNLRQNLLERLFKVATVDVETAMGHGRDLKLSVLGLADAERFREELLGAAHLHPNGQPKLDEPVLTLSSHDLIWGALTENHLAQVIVALLTVGGPAVGIFSAVADRIPRGIGLPILVAGWTLLAIGAWFWGAVSYYLKFGGFAVHRSETVFRISYGLLNKVQLAIRPARIEYVHMTMTLPQRWMGRASLKVGTAASFGEAGIFAPVALFVKRSAADAGAAEVIPGLDIANLDWRPLAPVFYWSRAVRALIWIVVIASITTGICLLPENPFIVKFASVGAALCSIILIRLICLFLARAENGFALTETTLVSRMGYYTQSISAMPILRMENIAVTQPWWWKRRRAVTVSVQAMRQRIHVGSMPESDLEDLVQRWRDVIDTRENLKLYQVSLSAEAAEPAEVVEPAEFETLPS